MPRPAYNLRTQLSPNCHTRARGPIDYGGLHTQEGDGTAASLANFLCNPNSQVSYHHTVDNNRNVVLVVKLADASWSVGNANNRVVNVCFAGSRASWTRQQWLTNMGNAIEIAAWLQVEAALEFKFDPVVRSWDELKAGKSGLTDHYGINECILQAKGHWDVGGNFPWDVYAAHVRRFAAELTGTAPISVQPEKTLIEQCRAANDWLGDKVTVERELPTPDGDGRFVHYQFGSVYFHSRVGTAVAVPVKIRNKWELQGWEAGQLGYPTKPKLDLVAFTRTSNGQLVQGGVVQAFEGGTVYAPDNGPAFIMKGLIKDRYASLRYETGDLGWPQSDENYWGNQEFGGATQQFEHGVIVWINQGNSTIALTSVGNVIFPQYIPTEQERRLTPVDGMKGGISHFAGVGDASTTGRNMGISGEPADTPLDPWYCAMRFNYCRITDHPTEPFWVKTVPGTSDLVLKAYLKDRRLMITNPLNGKKVVVRPADWGPGAWAKPGGAHYRVIDVSATAIDALDAVTDTAVTVEWVDPSTPLGPKG